MKMVTAVWVIIASKSSKIAVKFEESQEITRKSPRLHASEPENQEAMHMKVLKHLTMKLYTILLTENLIKVSWKQLK